MLERPARLRRVPENRRVGGSHHLGNVEAYRRDRRKDQLLQENGYFVLRFLAEDAGKKLDFVLDAIERAVIARSVRN